MTAAASDDGEPDCSGKVPTNLIIGIPPSFEEEARVIDGGNASRPRLPVKLPIRVTLERRLDQCCDGIESACDRVYRHEPPGAREIQSIQGRRVPGADDPDEARGRLSVFDDRPAARALLNALALLGYPEMHPARVRATSTQIHQ